MINYEKKDADESITAIINDPWVLIIEVNKQDVKDISQVKLIKKWGYINESKKSISNSSSIRSDNFSMLWHKRECICFWLYRRESLLKCNS